MRGPDSECRQPCPWRPRRPMRPRHASSHLPIFPSSHLPIFPSSHLPIFPSSHLGRRILGLRADKDKKYQIRSCIQGLLRFILEADGLAGNRPGRSGIAGKSTGVSGVPPGGADYCRPAAFPGIVPHNGSPVIIEVDRDTTEAYRRKRSLTDFFIG